MELQSPGATVLSQPGHRLQERTRGVTLAEHLGTVDIHPGRVSLTPNTWGRQCFRNRFFFFFFKMWVYLHRHNEASLERTQV